jgi:hypothetical protein
MNRKFGTIATALVTSASLCFAGGVLGTSAYAAHGKPAANAGRVGTHAKPTRATKPGRGATHSKPTKPTTGKGRNGGMTRAAAAQTCNSTLNNSIFQYTGSSGTAQSMPASHGACVSTLASGGHSSAIAASLCHYLVHSAHANNFSGLALASGFPAGAAATALNGILGQSSLTNATFNNTGQCVRAYNQAKNAYFRSVSAHHSA